MQRGFLDEAASPLRGFGVFRWCCPGDVDTVRTDAAHHRNSKGWCRPLARRGLSGMRSGKSGLYAWISAIRRASVSFRHGILSASGHVNPVNLLAELARPEEPRGRPVEPAALAPPPRATPSGRAPTWRETCWAAHHFLPPGSRHLTAW